MHFNWYLNRLKKMGPAEIAKRLAEFATILYSKGKYKDPKKWPYNRFTKGMENLVIDHLSGHTSDFDHRSVRVYGDIIDVSQPIEWQRSDISGKRWPLKHWSAINYRPGNIYGDIRINWELNRLQFLPHLSLTDPELAINILKSWLRNNPYLHGPAYVASMEVALRWISIYRSVCLMKCHLDQPLLKDLTGFAVASGKYINSRLSTHSSAGNHLIVEAVGLFWLGQALGDDPLGRRWRSKARKILWQQIPAQISPDGTGKEQSFWYLGFVLDAVFHYLLLEKRALIPRVFFERVERALEFVDLLVLPNGTFFDFGDRDDGYVFRADGEYQEPFFNGLLDIGAAYFDRPEWVRCSREEACRTTFWSFPKSAIGETACGPTLAVPETKAAVEPFLKTFSHGGMTLMKWENAQVLFRHGPLGLGNTCGHGHADALSVLMNYGNTPVLVDLGSGQYNGDQEIRNFFRSTAAHNTIALAGKDQAQIVGPFLWKKPYKTRLLDTCMAPFMAAEASHDGYKEAFNTVHIRKVEWHTPYELEIIDLFKGPGGIPMKGAFHLGSCKQVSCKQNRMIAVFSDFCFSISFPEDFTLEVFNGSKSPFMGWSGGIYGKCFPIYSVVFKVRLEKVFSYRLRIEIDE